MLSQLLDSNRRGLKLLSLQHIPDVGSDLVPSWVETDILKTKANHPTVQMEQTFVQKEFLSRKTPICGNKLLPECFQDKLFKILPD